MDHILCREQHTFQNGCHGNGDGQVAFKHNFWDILTFNIGQIRVILLNITCMIKTVTCFKIYKNV